MCGRKLRKGLHDKEGEYQSELTSKDAELRRKDNELKMKNEQIVELRKRLSRVVDED